MKCQASAFLESQKKTLREIIDACAEEYSYVSILGTDVYGQDIFLDGSGMGVHPAVEEERGFVLRVYHESGFSEYSFNHVDKEEVLREIHKAVKQDRSSFLARHASMAYPGAPEDRPLRQSYFAEISRDPLKDEPSQQLNLLKQTHDAALQEYPGIIFLQLELQWTQVNKLFLSKQRELEQSYFYTVIMAYATAREGENVQSYYATKTGVDPWPDGSALLTKAREACEGALQLLKAETLEPGVYDIIVEPEFSGLIAHEAFGHGTEMDMFVKDRAKGREYLGKTVAAPAVRMHDGATAYRENSSYLFDDEGNLGGDGLIIEQGIFARGMADELTALQLGVTPTGNGKRESYKRKAYTRMTNTFFEAGEDDLDEMIASIKHGYLLHGCGSGMEDPKNWGIQCQAQLGREIVDGKFSGKIVAPVTLTGYVPDLLQSMSRFSRDLELNGAGYCGKGWKEYVRVSLGGPYIKARGKLS